MWDSILPEMGPELFPLVDRAVSFPWKYLDTKGQLKIRVPQKYL